MFKFPAYTLFAVVAAIAAAVLLNIAHAHLAARIAGALSWSHLIYCCLLRDYGQKQR